MSATKTFQSWLVKARKKHGLTYAALAEKAGVSTATVHGIEHTDTSPSLDTVEKLCKALGTSVESAVRVNNRSGKHKPKPSPNAAGPSADPVS